MNSNLSLSENYLRSKFPLARILSPQGGLLSGVVRMGSDASTPDFHVATTHVGKLSEIFPNLIAPNGNDMSSQTIGGAGADIDPELAWIRAVMAYAVDALQAM